MEVLHLIQEEQRRKQQQKILEILQDGGRAEAAASKSQCPIALPLKYMSDANDMENYLTVHGNFLQMVIKMSKIGGKDVTNATNRIISRLLANELAERMNFKGTKGKFAFGNMRIKDVVIRAIMQQFHSSITVFRN